MCEIIKGDIKLNAFLLTVPSDKIPFIEIFVQSSQNSGLISMSTL